MNAIAAVVALAGAITSMASVSGRVVNEQGAPIAGARVFAEQGLGAALKETVSDLQGRWSFDGLTGNQTGVFASADGYAFGGVTVRGGLGASIAGTTITLLPPVPLEGQVTSYDKKPVQGARITRVVLIGAAKVSIPFAKLKAFGFEEPVSDKDGLFTIERLPQGGHAILKVAHRDYAQEATGDIAVGGAADITLHRGVLVEGDVVARAMDAQGRQAPVGGVAVMIRNAQPPHDTAVTKTDSFGAFLLRLKPGVYACQAVTSTYRSAGWRNLAVPDQGAAPRLRLVVAEVGRIHGKVCDAKTGEPVAGARVLLDTQGNMAASEPTGPTGEFVFTAMEGENVVRLESAPGYQAPEQPALRVQVAAGASVPLPTFWLVPLPTYTVTVVDAADAPVPQAVVTVLRPHQFGWRMTDAEGKVDVAFRSLPPDGAVAGLAQWIARTDGSQRPFGALFAMQSDTGSKTRVRLFETGTVRGRVVSEEGGPVAGVRVSGLLGENGFPLWQTVTATDGTFQWQSVLPQLPQTCAVQSPTGARLASAPYTVDVAGDLDLGDLKVSGAASAATWRGKRLEWYRNRLLAGTLPERKARKHLAAAIVYCGAEEAPIMIDGLRVARDLLGTSQPVFAVVIDGPYKPTGSDLLVLSGKRPGAATTYLTNHEGVVALETFGMPPLHALRQLAATTE
ncbi:MAG: DUF1416 domain-containing protein [Nitrospiraceae bacterium]|nr:DUF1416 domain-containing protein [Nitrospiraceae bacterium]